MIYIYIYKYIQYEGKSIFQLLLELKMCDHHNNPLPTKDRLLIEKIDVTFEELINGDYREIWEKFVQRGLLEKDIKRLKHIRKREKNKLFEKEKSRKYNNEMKRLRLQKERLLGEKRKLLLECELFRRGEQF